jgi:hypothetical protein
LFREQFGKELEYKRLGFEKLTEYMRTVDGVEVFPNPAGEGPNIFKLGQVPSSAGVSTGVAIALYGISARSSAGSAKRGIGRLGQVPSWSSSRAGSGAHFDAAKASLRALQSCTQDAKITNNAVAKYLASSKCCAQLFTELAQNEVAGADGGTVEVEVGDLAIKPADGGASIVVQVQGQPEEVLLVAEWIYERWDQAEDSSALGSELLDHEGSVVLLRELRPTAPTRGLLRALVKCIDRQRQHAGTNELMVRIEACDDQGTDLADLYSGNPITSSTSHGPIANLVVVLITVKKHRSRFDKLAFDFSQLIDNFSQHDFDMRQMFKAGRVPAQLMAQFESLLQLDRFRAEQDLACVHAVDDDNVLQLLGRHDAVESARLHPTAMLQGAEPRVEREA